MIYTNTNVCSECGGKCCKNGNIFITKYEYDQLKNDDKKKHITSLGSSYILNTKPCVYLENDKCILGDDRFVDCKIYPWIIGESVKDDLVLSTSCPYNKNFNNTVNKSNAELLIIRNFLKGNLTSDDIKNYHSINYTSELK